MQNKTKIFIRNQLLIKNIMLKTVAILKAE